MEEFKAIQKVSEEIKQKIQVSQPSLKNYLTEIYSRVVR